MTPTTQSPDAAPAEWPDERKAVNDRRRYLTMYDPQNARRRLDRRGDNLGDSGHRVVTKTMRDLASVGALRVPGEAAPIDMVLHCPSCHLQHVDESDERTPKWDNPPHRSHLCHGCGSIWRPADVATNGVRALKTRGSGDALKPSVDPTSPETNWIKL